MPTNEVSLIPKAYKAKKIGLESIFSKVGIVAVVLLVLSLLVWGGLFYYNSSLNNQLTEVSGQIEEIDKQRNEQVENELKALDKSLENLRAVLENHLYWSKVFNKIEDLTVPQVAFSDFDAGLGEDGIVELTLSGKAAGYTYLARQMISFSEEDMVVGIEVSNITSSTEGGVEFGLKINLSKDILLK